MAKKPITTHTLSVTGIRIGTIGITPGDLSNPNGMDPVPFDGTNAGTLSVWWRPDKPVIFDTPFAPSTQPHDIAVIITPFDDDPPSSAHPGDGPTGHHPGVVPIAQRVTRTGFHIAARNSDTAGGKVKFAYAAFATSGSGATSDGGKPIDVRLGQLQPQLFSPGGQPFGFIPDWALWSNRFDPLQPQNLFPIEFSEPLDSNEGRKVLLATATSLHCQTLNPVAAQNIPTLNPVAAVGIPRAFDNLSFFLTARNSDCAMGYCAFNYAALSYALSFTSDDIRILSGFTPAADFNLSCQFGDWNSWDIYFSQPFGSLPVILITATDIALISNAGENVPAVGVAENVTPYGFTLAARNSDVTSPGSASFYFVAIGCGAGCG